MEQESVKSLAAKNLARNNTAQQTRNNPPEKLLRGFVASEPAKVSRPAGCPYPLPEGVRLIRYTRKDPPVPLTVCSIVTDVPKFIRHALAELAARLHDPVQIKAGDSTFELISKLADCGVELRLEWPERKPEDTKSPDPSGERGITDEDVAF